MPGDSSDLPNENTSFSRRPNAKSEVSDKSGLLQVRRSGLCPFPKRYILAIMLFFGYSMLFITRTGMSVAIVAMVKNTTAVVNGTEMTVIEFDWSPYMQGLLLGAFSWGTVVIQIPAGMLSNMFGGKVMYACGILGFGVFNILTPPAAKLGGLSLLIALEILEGVVEGLCCGTLQALCSKWAPPMERTRMTTIAYSGSFFGAMLGMMVSGEIADFVGWQWIFYIYGTCDVMYVVCWYWLISETPKEHPTITSEELEYITNSIGILHKDTTPWKSILTSLPFWALVVSHFASYWNYHTLILQLPTFLSEIGHISLQKRFSICIHNAIACRGTFTTVAEDEVGFLSALPFLAFMITILVGGQLADLIRSRAWLGTTNVRKLYFCTGFAGQCVTWVVACQVIDEPLAVICLILSAGFNGFTTASLIVNPQDIAPQFADIIWTVSNTGGNIASFSSSAVAGALTSNKTPEEWQHVFYLCACMSCVGCIVSGIFISGSLQPWAQSSTASADEKKTDHTTDYNGTASKAEQMSSK